MKKRCALLLFFVLAMLAAKPLAAQDSLRQSAVIMVPELPYTFINKQANFIENDTVLRNFYKKLDELRSGKRKRLVILHIGDSHIQADNFTGSMRRQFQQQFGNGGRGLYFPYRTAKTNGPFDIKDVNSCACEWKSKRCVFPGIPIPIGISGITLQTSQAAQIDFYLSQKDQTNRFNRITIFSDKSAAYTIQPEVYDVTNAQYVCPFQLQSGRNPFASTYTINFPIDTFRLNISKTDSSSEEAFNLYGLYLQDTKAHGVEYNMIGVNGAQFTHYNQAEYFFTQLEALKPDLVIVSLGTNEAIGLHFDETALREDAASFIAHLQATFPTTSILLTAPPDSYLMRKYKNANTAKVAAVEWQLCQEQHCAFWNFYKVMGGYGSALKWKRLGYGNADLVHLLSKGYEVQGQLLYRALMESYLNYQSH